MSTDRPPRIDNKREILASTSPEDQVAKLRAYFRDYLSNWYTGIIAGVQPRGNQAAILGELALALAQFAAVAILSDPTREDDDEIVADCERMATEYVGKLVERFAEKASVAS